MQHRIGWAARKPLLVLTAMAVAGAVVVLGADVADAQVQPAGVCSRNNPSACFQFFGPTRPAPAPAPAPAPIPTAPPVVVPPLPAPVVVAPPAPPAAPVSLPDAARQLLDLVNGERARAGLGQLASRDDITRIALDHSFRMAAAGNIFHNDDYFSTTVKNQIGSLVRGENVALNTTIEDTHRRLMNSPGHRANIVDGRFNTVGFAVVRTAEGQIWVTQDFAQTRGGAAPAAAAAPAAITPRPAATTPRPVVATPPPPAPAPAPVVIPGPVELATATLTMSEPIALAGPDAGTTLGRPTLTGGQGSGGMGASLGILAIVLLAAAGAGSWRLRQVTAQLWA